MFQHELHLKYKIVYAAVFPFSNWKQLNVPVVMDF